MTPAYRTAYVYVRNIFAGILSETDKGYSFEYDCDYLNLENVLPVSLTLPVQKDLSKKGILYFCRELWHK